MNGTVAGGTVLAVHSAAKQRQTGFQHISLAEPGSSPGGTACMLLCCRASNSRVCCKGCTGVTHIHTQLGFRVQAIPVGWLRPPPQGTACAAPPPAGSSESLTEGSSGALRACCCCCCCCCCWGVLER